MTAPQRSEYPFQISNKRSQSMKKAIAGFASLAVLSVVAIQALPSQQQYSKQEGPLTFAVEGGMDRVTVLTHLLGLNTSQQANAKAIFDEEDAVTKPLFEQLKDASEAMVTAQKNAAPDAEIDQLARDMAGICGEILAIDAKAQSKIYRELSADQKQKLEQFPHPPFFGVSAPLLPAGPGPMLVTSGKRGQD
jgi:Spy/CpxP family protein refolding chaperone